MQLQLRCAGTLHGIVQDDEYIEIKCKRRVCGGGPGIVVLHRFNIHTGEVTTRRFAEPKKERIQHGTGQPGTAVRSA